MPVENFEEEGLPKNPKLELAQYKFLLTTDKKKNNRDVKEKLLAAIVEDNMAPWYAEICKDLGWSMDTALLQKMKDANKGELDKLDSAVEDAEKNLGETEVRDAMIAKANYLSKIGDKEGVLSQFRKIQERTLTLGVKLDIVFHQIRIGLFYMDHDLINRNIDKAQTLIEEGGDWDRRNRLKVYKGVYCMAIRDFKKASELFLDTLATFTSYEVCDYKDFVAYTVYCGMVALDRPTLREKVVRGAEIQEVLHSLPNVKNYLESLFKLQYGSFFRNLAITEQVFKHDRYLCPHYRFYTREMRVLAYKQLLESYSSLTLDYMAKAFGVTTDFIDTELSRFIAQGRLHCKIDKVNGIVETNRPDRKNDQYQTTIKQGDLLLNRVQKLGRVINV